jgi:uncharacterized protein (TIGR01777 family)
LSEVCLRWETAALPVRRAGTRLAFARLGVVLSVRGGMLPRILPAICSGMGGVLGNGMQRLSWIHEEDLAKAFVHILTTESFDGPVNVVSPLPVSNADLSTTLSDRLHRPHGLHMPERVVNWLFGEMGDEMLLADIAVKPKKLMESGFQWDYAEIGDAIDDLMENRSCCGPFFKG